MHVAQLFHALGLAPDHKAVKPALPDVTLFEYPITKPALRCFGVCSPRLKNLARESLLENLHDNRGIALLRFADQEMKMLRHHDIAHHGKLIPEATLLQCLEKQIPASGAPQKRAPLITTGGDEMQILRPVESFETFRHVAIVGLWLAQVM
jgi:hypothetical protein